MQMANINMDVANEFVKIKEYMKEHPMPVPGSAYMEHKKVDAIRFSMEMAICEIFREAMNDFCWKRLSIEKVQEMIATIKMDIGME